MREPPEDADEAPAGAEGLVVGASGWFTPHGVRYHEDRRRRDEIAPEDWAALLAHADSVDFFTRPDPAPPAPDARIYHLHIVSADRSRELAINDPFEAPELARLISLVRRCLRDREVITTETMSDELRASLMRGLQNGADWD